jgi:hypothetical protein
VQGASGHLVGGAGEGEDDPGAQGGDQLGQPRRVGIDEHHRPAIGQPPGHLVVQDAAGSLVQARPRLVQHQQPGPGQQRLGDGDLLAHALGLSFNLRGRAVS